MIVKISASGTSFKGLSQYLTHDPKAQTNERVAWTHSHNLANDDIPCAVNEMYLTAENAELLKQQAGIRAGGRKSENPVKHISLNWAPADNPSQKHMIETAQHFLDSMGWGEHQAIFVAHDDKSYKHVHIILNAIHPETGRHLDEGWEHNRAQRWAAEYERAQDCIRCPQRLQERETREKAMPRNMWIAFQQNEKSFLHAEELLRQNSEKELNGVDNIRNSEWRILKDIQRDERQQFFADGKRGFSELRNSIYRTVHGEFRERWNEYYQARRSGADSDGLRELRRGIISDEKAVLEPRRDAACKELRANRDIQYREILDIQREERQTLRWHQQLGLDTSDFFADTQNRRDARVTAEDFGAAGQQVTRQGSVRGAEDHEGQTNAARPFDRGVRPLARASSFGTSLLGSLILQFTNLGSAPAEPKTKAEREDEFRMAAEEDTKRREKTSQDLEEEDRRRTSKAYNGRER
jgi:hypothetical protein